MNLIKVKWVGATSVHPDLGGLEPGKTYDVPEDLGKAWVAQGVAETVRGKSAAKDKE